MTLQFPVLEDPVVSRLRVGLGTFIAVETRARTLELAEAGISAAYDAIALVERLMHPRRAGSDLAALRDAPLEAALRIHPWTWATLDLCQRVQRLSHGVFDPCIAGSPGGLRDLELRHPHTIIPHARLDLDLGGIAKGFAVDRALDALRTSGCVDGLVNAGGDVAVFGERDHEIACRRHDGRTAVVSLRNAALAASDTDNDSRPTEHRGYYHGVNRRATISGYAAVMAPSAAVADALTKCLLAATGPTGELLEAFGARFIRFGEVSEVR
jgi:thiamine biosynthesis lipoprotein